MNLVCIVLGDNDFGNTFVPLLKSIHQVLLYNPDMTEKDLFKIIHLGIDFHYTAYQNKQDTTNIYEYLKKIKILFDDEASKFISTNDHDGGSWFLEISSGKVESF